MQIEISMRDDTNLRKILLSTMYLNLFFSVGEVHGGIYGAAQRGEID